MPQSSYIISPLLYCFNMYVIEIDVKRSKMNKYPGL